MPEHRPEELLQGGVINCKGFTPTGIKLGFDLQLEYEGL